MSGKPEAPDKIWIQSPTFQRCIPNDHRQFYPDNVEYIRADLAKPSEQPKMDVVELNKYAKKKNGVESKI